MLHRRTQARQRLTYAGSLAAQGAVLVARPKRRVFPGNPDQARQARLFVTRTLDGCPAADTAVLLTSELVSNAISHTRTGKGGSFEIIVWRGLTATCIAVLDSGSDDKPALRNEKPDVWSLGLPRETGRGLTMVDALATRWGHEGGRGGRALWFLLRWACP